MRNFLLSILLAIPFFGVAQVDTIGTQSSFNGVVTFFSFIPDVTQGGQYSGTLTNFTDQTNTYFANNIQVGDVVFDNLGQQWYVIFVGTTTLLTAEVHLKAIGFTPISSPFGVGALGRLSETGLFPSPPNNANGISDQLRTRIIIHNQLVVNRYMRDSFATELPPFENNLYVDPLGNNATAQKGRIDLPFADPWAASVDTSGRVDIRIFEGTYENTTFDDNPQLAQSITRADTTSISATGNIDLWLNGQSSSGGGAFTDMRGTFYTNPKPKKVLVDAPGLTYRVTSNGSAIPIPFNFAHSESEVDVKIKRLVGDGGRTWAFISNSKRFSFDVEEVNVTGDIFGGFSGPTDDPGVISRDVNVRVKRAIINTTTGTSGAGVLRMQNQSTTVDSLSNFRFDFGYFESSHNADLVNISSQTPIKLSTFNFDFDRLVKTGSSSRGLFGTGSVTNDTMSNSVINLNVATGDSLEIQQLFVAGTMSLSNSQLNFNFGELQWDLGGSTASWGASSSRTTLIDSRIAFNCVECKRDQASGAFFDFDDKIFASGTSEIVITGSWKQTGDFPIINVSSISAEPPRIILKNAVFENSGNVAAIQSAVPVTIYVAGAYDANTIISDPNVTIVRLDEYGLASVGGGAVDTFEVENLAAVLDFDAAIGRTITTRGYSTAGDGGGAKYLVVAPADTIPTYVNDSIAVIPVSNGNYAVLQPTPTYGYRPEWFGAVTDDGLPDSTAFKKIVRWATRDGIEKRIECAPGTYNDPLLRIYKNDNGGVYETIGLEIVGAAWPYTDNPGIARATAFTFSSDHPGIIIQSARAVKIENIYFRGTSTAPFSNKDSLILFQEADWARHHSASKYTPHAAIVIDPFYSTSPTQYPGLSSFYTHSGGGSSMVNIENCSYANLDVAVAELGTANGDNIRITNGNADNLRRFYVTYCSQSRQGSINNIYGKNIQTVFFNDGIGAPPAIRNFSGAAFVREIFDVITQESKLTIDNSQFESLWRIGRVTAFPTSFSQTQFKFSTDATLPKPTVILAGTSGTVLFDGCTLVYFDNNQTRIFPAIAPIPVHFEGCHFQMGMPYTLTTAGGIQNMITYENCRFGIYSNAPITTGEVPSLYVGGDGLSMVQGESVFTLSDDEEIVLKGGIGSNAFSLGAVTLTQTTDRTRGYFILADSTERVRVGTAITTNDNVFSNPPNYFARGSVGQVEFIIEDTIHLKNLSYGTPFGTPFTANVMSPQKPLIGVFGDVEVGNDTIKNVYGFVGNSWYSPFLTGIRFDIPGFKTGTYLKSSDISTPGFMVMSSKSTITQERVPIKTTVDYTHTLRSPIISGFPANKTFTEGQQIISTDPNSSWVSATVDTSGKWSAGLFPVFSIQDRVTTGTKDYYPYWGSNGLTETSHIKDSLNGGIFFSNDVNNSQVSIKPISPDGRVGMYFETASSVPVFIFRGSENGVGAGLYTGGGLNTAIGLGQNAAHIPNLRIATALAGGSNWRSLSILKDDGNSRFLFNSQLTAPTGGNEAYPVEFTGPGWNFSSGVVTIGDTLFVNESIEMENSAAKINLASQLEILGASGGTAQSRILMNSSTAAGGTIISDRNPASPSDRAALTLDWDAASTLQTFNQQLTVGTGTAAQQYNASSLNFNPSSDANQVTIQDQGASDWLRFKRDFGAGGGYQLMYESGTFTNRTVFDATGDDVRFGSGFTEFFIDTDLEHSAANSDEKIMVQDTISGEVRLVDLDPTDYGSESASTDGSGDLTVSHDLGTASIVVTATATGTTFYNVQVHTKTSTNFKIRFFDATGAAVASTAVTVDWIAKE